MVTKAKVFQRGHTVYAQVDWLRGEEKFMRGYRQNCKEHRGPYRPCKDLAFALSEMGSPQSTGNSIMKQSDSWFKSTLAAELRIDCRKARGYECML